MFCREERGVLLNKTCFTVVTVATLWDSILLESWDRRIILVDPVEPGRLSLRGPSPRSVAIKTFRGVYQNYMGFKLLVTNLEVFNLLLVC